MQFKFKITILISLLLLPMLTFIDVGAQSVDQIKQNIDSHNEKIKKLDEEIKAYQRQVEITATEAKSLQNAVKVLDINQKKITTEIKKTETNIGKTNLTIYNLSSEISDIEKKIDLNTEAIAKTLSNMRQSDQESLIESFLANRSLADVLDEYESTNQFQDKIRDQSNELAEYKNKLSDKKTTTEEEKQKLLSFKNELGDQNQILVINKKEKSTLLTETKNKETEYKKILENRQLEKERAEKELFDFANQLKRIIDPNSFPSAKKGIIGYPLDNIYVTQAFGKTVDAKRLYVSGTHNGVDFRAARGTPVKSVLEGVVEGTGNTDSQKGCYSYGKWVLIKHPNGLSSLYSHLDLIKVMTGQNISLGELLGYSGQTGYATGPHLHFTLYASQGVQVQQYSASKNCKNTTIPIAPSNAYLDPMLYF